VYCTKAIPASELTPRLEQHAPWDVAVFAAPSGVKSFSQAWPTTRDFACVAIGETTAQTLRASDYPMIHVSATPLPEAIVEAIKNSLTKILS
jgi:uroporphyrinogen-III synthase